MEARTKSQIRGLTNQEVQQRVAGGQINDYEIDVSKSTKDILRDNILTLFNFLNFAIAICLALVGAYSNMFFIVIIIINIVTGCVVELRARDTVEKLSVLNRSKAVLLRDGATVEKDTAKIVIDDILVLRAGEQIPSDAFLVEGEIEVNEALLTGESDLIHKRPGDKILSGSYVASGHCHAQVEHVGLDNYSTKLAVEAKMHKPIHSELLGAIRKIAKFTSVIIIPLGAVLFLEAFFIRAEIPKDSVVSSAAALLGMLPKGMALLIVISLATAVIKLGQKKILVQEMYSVETLAHVDVLCLDKTGTITEGNMKIQQVQTLAPLYDEEAVAALMGSYIHNSKDSNITMQALKAYYTENDTYEASDIRPFASERKWAAMRFDAVGTLLLGAPDKMFTAASMPPEIMEAQKSGARILALGLSQAPVHDVLTGPVEPLAIFYLEDPIRKDAQKTLDYLESEGVELKIISGDNPITVSAIARKAGFTDYDNYVDVSDKTDDELKDCVRTYSIFGRVSPQQKKFIVQCLKKKRKTVAMTGDGVNDILALKEADCSIAMAQGDSATRQVSNIVLLESDFTTLPDVLFEGRRVVNNVTKVSSIFFIKTIYSFILSIICAISTLAFPFIPIQITLIDLAIEGYPSFFLSFENNRKKVEGNFLRTALLSALPNALLVVGNVAVVYLLSGIYRWSELETTTLMYLLLSAISVFAVIKACFPFNKLRAFLAITTTVGFFTAAWLFRSILHIGTLTANTALPFVLLLVISLLIRVLIAFVKKKRSTNIKVS
ncbi:MAG: cation-translocating P-type ATPase [Lachnospiraceae bacterium]